MSPAAMKMLEAAAPRLGVTLDPEAIVRIDRHLDLLLRWNLSTRLTGERDVDVIVRKHIIDSLAPVPHLPRTGLVVDIGSGAGFPGITLGSVRPDLPLVLLESRRRRVSFLREVIRRLPLPNARAIEERAEAAASNPALARQASVVVSRAIRLDLFLALARPLLADDGLAIAMQTPHAEGTAIAVAADHGLCLREQLLYTLPCGALRSLFLFAPADVATKQVPSR